MAHGKHRLRQPPTRTFWTRIMSETTRRRFTTLERIVAMICLTFIALVLIATFGA